MKKEELIEKTTYLICAMMLDFQSRTPENPITREDIRGYVEKLFALEEDDDAEEEPFEDSNSSNHVIVFENIQSGASW